jgi:hypothetical protein
MGLYVRKEAHFLSVDSKIENESTLTDNGKSCEDQAMGLYVKRKIKSNSSHPGSMPESTGECRSQPVFPGMIWEIILNAKSRPP